MSIKRIWLNPVSSSDNGWMKFGIELDGQFGGYNYSLKIADCNRVCDFSFDFDSKKGRRSAYKKLITMENALIDMREQCETIMKEKGEID